MKNFIFVLISSTSLILFASYSKAGKKTIEKEFRINRAEKVEIDFSDRDGEMFFSAWEKEFVLVRVHKETKIIESKKAERLLKQIKVNFSQHGNSIKIKIDYPRLRGFFLSIPDRERVKVTTEIMLPPTTNLACEIEDGSIQGENVEGNLKMTSEDGSIKLSNIHGSVLVSTEDGRVILDDIFGVAKISSEDGKILLRGQLEEVEIETEGGDIQLEVAKGSLMKADWRIKTEDGDVEVFFPSDFSSEIFLHTEDGHIDCSFPLIISHISSRKSLRAKINQGGYTFSISTQDGKISLRSLTLSRLFFLP